MKKIFFLLIALGGLLAAVSSCSKEDENDEKKEDTGIIDDVAAPLYAASKKQWLIENDTLHIRQIWSDAIKVPTCSGRDITRTYDAPQCRNAGGYEGAGYLYNGVYVREYKSTTLCTIPWRVPSILDFVDLDLALGGTGDSLQITQGGKRYNSQVWGGTYCSYYAEGEFDDRPAMGAYWSSSESNDQRTYALAYNDTLVSLRKAYRNHWAFQVRCVR